MAHLNSVTVEASHKSLPAHPFRNALLLLLAGAGASIATAQAAQQRTPQKPSPAPVTASAPPPSMASMTTLLTPVGSGTTASTPSTSNEEIKIPDKLPTPAEMIPNKTYYYQAKGQVFACTMLSTPFSRMLHCLPTNMKPTEPSQTVAQNHIQGQ